MAEDLFLVFSNPVDGQESSYAEWYENTHLSDVLKVPGVVAAQRYRIAPMEVPDTPEQPAPPPPPHRFLAVYELDRDPDQVMAEFVRRVTCGEMVLHEALDMASVSMATWRPAGRRQASATPVR